MKRANIVLEHVCSRAIIQSPTRRVYCPGLAPTMPISKRNFEHSIWNEKFHNLVYGRHVDVESDHKPLKWYSKNLWWVHHAGFSAWRSAYRTMTLRSSTRKVILCTWRIRWIKINCLTARLSQPSKGKSTLSARFLFRRQLCLPSIQIPTASLLVAMRITTFLKFTSFQDIVFRCSARRFVVSR